MKNSACVNRILERKYSSDLQQTCVGFIYRLICALVIAVLLHLEVSNTSTSVNYRDCQSVFVYRDHYPPMI